MDTVSSNSRPAVQDLYRRAVGHVGSLLEQVPDTAWRSPTPCAEWDVRALVEHLVEETRWIVPLLAGSTVEEAAPELAGHALGDDPAAAWHAAVGSALVATQSTPLERTVHLSFGDFPAEEYLWQVTTDALVHGWDLARATGQGESLDAEVVEQCGAWFDSTEAAYRAAGVVGPVVVAADDRDPASRLIGRFGRDPSPNATLAVLNRFGAAWDAKDLEEIAELLTSDCHFVDTSPPHGGSHEGRDAVLDAFGRFFASSPDATFETVGGFVDGRRAAMQWLYRWGPSPRECISGVDLFEVRDGLVAEKLSYVKG